MAYVKVNVYLSEFDTDDLVEELRKRDYEHEVIEFINEKLTDRLNGLTISNLNILEESKLNYFLENFDKITEEQLKQIVEK